MNSYINIISQSIKFTVFQGIKVVTSLALFFVLMLLMNSCSKEEDLDPKSVLNDTKPSLTETDKYIQDNFVTPYNIEVKYYWDRNLAGDATYSYPVEESKVMPMLEAIKALYIDLFMDSGLGMTEYFKKSTPLRIVLYGGENKNINGIELITSPDVSPIEMHIYNVNSFDKHDETKVFILARALFHQFARRLVELYPYDREAFANISRNRYKEDTNFLIPMLSVIKDRRSFYDYSPYTLPDGFFSIYSAISPELDFAEILSLYLTTTLKDRVEAYKTVYRLVPAEGEDEASVIEEMRQEASISENKIKEKEVFVEAYLKDMFDVSLNKMSLSSLYRINKILKEN